MPVAAVHHQDVAIFDIPHQVINTGNGRDATTAGNDCRMACLASSLRDDAGDFGVTEGDRLRGKKFVGDNDQRT